MMKCRGFWADYIDPCSGLSVRSMNLIIFYILPNYMSSQMISKETNKVYSEVYGAEILLGYRSQNAGCCKILLHPSWGAVSKMHN